MSRDRLYMKLLYVDQEESDYPVMILRMDDQLPRTLIPKLTEQGFSVEAELKPIPMLTVTAKTKTKRLEMTAKLVRIIKAWHDECCGVGQFSCILQLESDLSGFKLIHHAPSPDSYFMHLGALKGRWAVAYLMEDYREMAQLQLKIDALAAGLPA